MQDKKAKKRAAVVNRFLQPELVDEDYDKKMGRSIPRTKRDMSAIIYHQDRALRKEDPSLPRDVSPSHMMVVKRLMGVALRENSSNIEVECPHCLEKHEIALPSVKLEQNSLKALESLADRMFPRLGNITHEVNLQGQISTYAEKISAVIVKYVPPEKRMLALGEIYSMLEGKENQNDQTKSENYDSNMLVSIA